MGKKDEEIDKQKRIQVPISTKDLAKLKLLSLERDAPAYQVASELLADNIKSARLREKYMVAEV